MAGGFENGGIERFVSGIQMSARRLRSNMESIYEKYDKPFQDDDLINLSTLTVCSDKGSLRKLRGQHLFGSSKLQSTKRKDELLRNQVGLPETAFDPNVSRAIARQCVSYLNDSAVEAEPSDAETLSSDTSDDDGDDDDDEENLNERDYESSEEAEVSLVDDLALDDSIEIVDDLQHGNHKDMKCRNDGLERVGSKYISDYESSDIGNETYNVVVKERENLNKTFTAVVNDAPHLLAYPDCSFNSVDLTSPANTSITSSLRNMSFVSIHSPMSSIVGSKSQKVSCPADNNFASRSLVSSLESCLKNTVVSDQVCKPSIHTQMIFETHIVPEKQTENVKAMKHFDNDNLKFEAVMNNDSKVAKIVNSLPLQRSICAPSENLSEARSTENFRECSAQFKYGKNKCGLPGSQDFDAIKSLKSSKSPNFTYSVTQNLQVSKLASTADASPDKTNVHSRNIDTVALFKSPENMKIRRVIPVALKGGKQNGLLSPKQASKSIQQDKDISPLKSPKFVQNGQNHCSESPKPVMANRIHKKNLRKLNRTCSEFSSKNNYNISDEPNWEKCLHSVGFDQRKWKSQVVQNSPPAARVEPSVYGSLKRKASGSYTSGYFTDSAASPQHSNDVRSFTDHTNVDNVMFTLASSDVDEATHQRNLIQISGNSLPQPQGCSCSVNCLSQSHKQNQSRAVQEDTRGYEWADATSRIHCMIVPAYNHASCPPKVPPIFYMNCPCHYSHSHHNIAFTLPNSASNRRRDIGVQTSKHSTASNAEMGEARDVNHKEAPCRQWGENRRRNTQDENLIRSTQRSHSSMTSPNGASNNRNRDIGVQTSKDPTVINAGRGGAGDVDNKQVQQLSEHTVWKRGRNSNSPNQVSSPQRNYRSITRSNSVRNFNNRRDVGIQASLLSTFKFAEREIEGGAGQKHLSEHLVQKNERNSHSKKQNKSLPQRCHSSTTFFSHCCKHDTLFKKCDNDINDLSSSLNSRALSVWQDIQADELCLCDQVNGSFNISNSEKSLFADHLSRSQNNESLRPLDKTFETLDAIASSPSNEMSSTLFSPHISSDSSRRLKKAIEESSLIRSETHISKQKTAALRNVTASNTSSSMPSQSAIMFPPSYIYKFSPLNPARIDSDASASVHEQNVLSSLPIIQDRIKNFQPKRHCQNMTYKS